MKNAAVWILNGLKIREWLAAVLTVAILVAASHGLTPKAWAADDLPLASASALTGVTFEDKPLFLPVQRNFQMAMLTSSSELGRTCGRMEAYGWRMSQTEQKRVNQIFTNTVDKLRQQGFTVAPQNLSSVAKDITLFTADKNDRHFIFLWSAGNLGLVMTLCETSLPVAATAQPTQPIPSVQVFSEASDVVTSRLEGNARAAGAFSPLGKWDGSYICDQGFTGGTLDIEHVSGQNFDGTFKFYPTAKNPEVPSGAYRVYGQYDKASNRVLINPGKWISRPAHYYDTVMVGQFDAGNDKLSAFFQGISGCTSFEAHRAVAPKVDAGMKKKHRKPVKSLPAKKHVAAPVKAPVAQIMAPPATAPAVPALAAPAPVAPPASVIAPAPTPVLAPAAAPAAAAAPPAGGLAIAPPTPIAAPTSAPAPVPQSMPVPQSSVAPTVPSVRLPDPVAPTVPAQMPGLPAEDKSDAGITLTAPSK